MYYTLCFFIYDISVLKQEKTSKSLNDSRPSNLVPNVVFTGSLCTASVHEDTSSIIMSIL